ncbi:MAG TPA: hypothetical protein VKM55_00785 [Candidatus Lokiarchaeia archaeon]|nr:hypothetical protein [Candidatus Lokiarchaeia archaeon]
MTTVNPGMRETTLFKREERLLSELDKLKKEKTLLEKQNMVISKQATEIRENFQEMRAEYAALENKVKKEAEINKEQYMISAFIDGIHGPSSILKNAVKYCETHDGCPFLSIGCDQSSHAECHGIWVRMGVPCATFAGKIKTCMKSMNGLRK